MTVAVQRGPRYAGTTVDAWQLLMLGRNRMATHIFTPEELDRIVQQTIVPETDSTHTHIVVGTVDQNGVQVVAQFKKSPDSVWSLQAAARHDWSGDNEVGASVLLKW